MDVPVSLLGVTEDHGKAQIIGSNLSAVEFFRYAFDFFVQNLPGAVDQLRNHIRPDGDIGVRWPQFIKGVRETVQFFKAVNIVFAVLNSSPL